MTLITKISNGAEYLYFQAGKKSMYIAPKNDRSKARIENVIKALEYTQDRMEHYAASYDELLQLLPPAECKKYAKR